MKTFITTNIRVPKEDLAMLKQDAARRGQSVSFLLRTAIRQYIQKPHYERVKKTPLSRLQKYAVKTGKKQLSRQIDDIVYGK